MADIDVTRLRIVHAETIPLAVKGCKLPMLSESLQILTKTMKNLIVSLFYSNRQ